MSVYYYSASANTFYPSAMRADYQAAGTWPNDAAECPQEEFDMYGGGAAPDGMKRGADDSGRPAWVQMPAPTASQILSANTIERDAKLQAAGARIAPLQDAVDLGEATPDEETALIAWKRYRVALNRVDLTQYPAAWPSAPAA